MMEKQPRFSKAGPLMEKGGVELWRSAVGIGRYKIKYFLAHI